MALPSARMGAPRNWFAKILTRCKRYEFAAVLADFRTFRVCHANQLHRCK
eukprot:COSAG03_NODE_9828_length_691_cov_1.043919_1_plen_49_part_01